MWEFFPIALASDLHLPILTTSDATYLMITREWIRRVPWDKVMGPLYLCQLFRWRCTMLRPVFEYLFWWSYSGHWPWALHGVHGVRSQEGSYCPRCQHLVQVNLTAYLAALPGNVGMCGSHGTMCVAISRHVSPGGKGCSMCRLGICWCIQPFATLGVRCLDCLGSAL